jgi:hypothetical protein
MRRVRQRQRDGTLMITLAITPQQTRKLQALNLLDVCDLENRVRIAEAVSAALDDIEP